MAEPLVVLLRAPSVREPDPYSVALEAAGFRSAVVPVLRYEATGRAALRAALARPERYGGLVLTSPRAADALAEAGVPEGWWALPCWAVGEETARRARRLGLDARGEEAGDAVTLAELIVSGQGAVRGDESGKSSSPPGQGESAPHRRAGQASREGVDRSASASPDRPPPAPPFGSAQGRPAQEGSARLGALSTVSPSTVHRLPLLFPCGDRRREVLPERLAEAGVPFEEVVVYETHLHPPPLLAPNLRPDWLVFFSPSSVEAAVADPAFPWSRARRAAIGPTTADALREAGFPPRAVAAAPKPEALAQALRAARG